jgi:hypothetical protein
MGCLFGRGETVIWTLGLEAAKRESRVLRNSLERWMLVWAMVERREEEGREKILHPPTAARPVAVVEVDALALQDEGADAILCGWRKR